MKRSTVDSLFAALMGLVLCSALPAAEESAQSSGPQERTAAVESVQKAVDKEAADKALERRKKIVAEATAAIRETKKALEALERKESDEALRSLEVATGKLELILARDPDLALAPVDVTVVTRDLLADLETVEEMIAEAEEHLEDGEVQAARPLAQLRGFALDFGELEKVFPCESAPGLWISPENPV